MHVGELLIVPTPSDGRAAAEPGVVVTPVSRGTHAIVAARVIGSTQLRIGERCWQLDVRASDRPDDASPDPMVRCDEDAARPERRIEEVRVGTEAALPGYPGATLEIFEGTPGIVRLENDAFEAQIHVSPLASGVTSVVVARSDGIFECHVLHVLRADEASPHEARCAALAGVALASDPPSLHCAVDADCACVAIDSCVRAVHASRAAAIREAVAAYDTECGSFPGECGMLDPCRAVCTDGVCRRSDEQTGP